MGKYNVFCEDHEVWGQSLLDISNAINMADYLPIFKKHGLEKLDPQTWYPLQKFFDVLNEIDEQGGDILDLVSIGMNIGSKFAIPPEMEALPYAELIKLTPQIYNMTHRGSNIGSFAVQEVTPKHFKVLLQVPDPDDLWYGIVYGFTRRCLMPTGQYFTVIYDENQARQENGGDITTIHINLD